MYFLFFNAIVVLLVGLFASKRAYAKTPAKWFLLASIGGFLWVLAYALIEAAQTEQNALMAGRFAFVGPMLGAPCLYYMIRTIAFEARPHPSSYLALFVVSACFHMPAIASDLVLSGVSIDPFGNKIWEYGSLAFLPGSFWFAIVLALAIGLVRERSSIEWIRVNRVLCVTLALLSWLVIGMATNVVMLMMLKDPRFYYVGPLSIFLPFSLIGLSVRWRVLPDVLGTLGRFWSNPRSRFIDSLHDFERNIGAFGSMDAAVNRFSEIIGGRVSMAFEGVGAAPAPGRLWAEPAVWDKFYSPSDRERWDRISEFVAQMDDSQQTPSSHGTLTTGWPKTSQFESPRDTLWPLASMASLRVSSLVAQRVADEPLVLLTDRSDSSFIRKGIERAAGRDQVFEDTYPDTPDDGREAGESLHRRISRPRESLLIVTIEVQACAVAYEACLKRLIDSGLKVVGLVRLDEKDLGECKAFSSKSLDQLDIPVIELFPSSEYPEDISAMIDVILLELDTMYGTRVRLSPEEREQVLSRISDQDAFPLVSLLEKIVLSKNSKYLVS